MRTDATLVLLALGGVLALHGLAWWQQPPLVALEEAARMEGARVAAEARVLRAHAGPRAQALTLTDGATRMDAFAPLDPPLRAGDEVLLVGVVARLDAGIGLSAERVVLLRAAATGLLAPGELAARPAAYDGARVAVLGDLRGDALVGGGARIDVRGEEPPAREGRFVATGSFRYHAADARYVLWVESWTRPS